MRSGGLLRVQAGILSPGVSVLFIREYESIQLKHIDIIKFTGYNQALAYLHKERLVSFSLVMYLIVHHS